MRLIIFSQPSISIRGHLHAQLEHGLWHRAITIPPHLDTQIKGLRPNATGISAPIERFLYWLDSYTSTYSMVPDVTFENFVSRTAVDMAE